MNDREALYELGWTLYVQGKLSEAQACFEQYLTQKAEPGFDEKTDTVPGLIENCKSLIQLEENLSEFLSGERKPSNTQESRRLGNLCMMRKKYAQAVRFYELADDDGGLRDFSKYHAGRSAVLVAESDAEPRLSRDEIVKLRRLALKWLSAALNEAKVRLKSGKQATQRLGLDNISQWRYDPDLKYVRDSEYRERLSPDEREAWDSFWLEIGTLLESM